MTTLEDLYYGNIHPCERDVVRGSPTDKLLRLLCKNEESLTATLTEQQKETFLKYKGNQKEHPLLIIDPEVAPVVKRMVILFSYISHSNQKCRPIRLQRFST